MSDRHRDDSPYGQDSARAKRVPILVPEGKRFQISLIISFFIHSLLLFRLSSSPTLIDSPKTLTSMEVTYHKLESKEKTISEEHPLSRRKLSSPFIDKDIFGIKRSNIQKEPISINKLTLEKKITLPEIPSPKITNPVYLNYYQMVREKIRLCAYRNYTRSEEGEVYLSFRISCDGVLKELNLIKERSKATEYLKRIALKSIQDASPFPAFPKDLDFPELSFNVIISFEVK